MNGKQIEKRKLKGYKIRPSIYTKAMKRAKKEGGTVANLLECVLIAYTYGLDIKAVNFKTGDGQTLNAPAADIFERIKAVKKTN